MNLSFTYIGLSLIDLITTKIGFINEANPLVLIGGLAIKLMVLIITAIIFCATYKFEFTKKILVGLNVLLAIVIINNCLVLTKVI